LRILQKYRQLEKYIYYLIIAELLIQLINAAFLILVNYYLLEIGYKDYEIAKFTSYRYISVVLLGIPFGLLYKKTNLLPLIKIGTVLFVSNAIAIILLAPYHHEWLMHILMFLFGVFLLMSHIVAMPFLIRIVDKDKMSIALSLFFQTWAASIIFIGIISFVYQNLFPDMHSTKYLLLSLFSISFIAIILLFKIPKNIQFKSNEHLEKVSKKLSLTEWKRIFYILFPTTLIAIGAGFCIPFFNLFFYYTYGIKAAGYSSIVSLSHILVLFIMFLTPWIKSRFGYRFGVLGIQSLGVLTLIILTWSHHFFALPYAMWIAVLAFVLRQPLMNSAQPLIAEFTIEKVGHDNQPLIQSMEATIWSGSFWISSLVFGVMREAKIEYYTIFNITILLYIFGVAVWYFVFRYFENKTIRES
jgi:MFS family permease